MDLTECLVPFIRFLLTEMDEVGKACVIFQVSVKQVYFGCISANYLVLEGESACLLPAADYPPTKSTYHSYITFLYEGRITIYTQM